MGRKRKPSIQTQATIQGGLTAKNSLSTALRLSDWDCFNYNQSLSLGNAFNNISIELLSLQQILLTYLYKTYGTLSKIVDVPVDDAFKNNGFQLQAESIDDDELDKLQKAVYKEVKRVKKAYRWARLFGGGAIVCVTGDDLDKPLNIQKLYGRNVRFMAVDKWQLNYSKPNINIPNGSWQLINYNKVNSSNANKIDNSRVFTVVGKDSPYIINMQLQGWGMSVFEQVFSDMSRFFKSRNVLFELLDEAKTDVLKLATMQTALSSSSGEAALQKMVDMIARNKNYKSQITLSTDDEYEQKQISFSGIAEILKEIRIMIAGASNMPVNKIWGEGVTGFGSGEDSLENYNSQIENEIRTPAEDLIRWICKIKSYQLFGRDIEDLEIEWKSLRVLSSMDEANIRNKKLMDALQLYDRKLLTPQELMEYLAKQDVFLHNTKAIRGELEELPLLEGANIEDVDDSY